MEKISTILKTSMRKIGSFFKTLFNLDNIVKKRFQQFIDDVHGKRIDTFTTIMYVLIGILLVGTLIRIGLLIKYPIVKIRIPPVIYAIMILLPIAMFFVTMIGDFYKKPYNRLKQFAFIMISTSIFTLGYLIEIANVSFVKAISSINNIQVVPYSLLEGNIKVVTFLPAFLVMIMLGSETVKIIFSDNAKKGLMDFEVEFLLPNVHKLTKFTVDLLIGKDLRNGLDVIIAEKLCFEHFWLQGGTGSGKTATYIRPVLAQLFKMKAFFREELKKVTFEALKEGLCKISKPVANNWFNRNFTMDLIEPVQDKKEEYLKKFKDLIIGVRDKETQIINTEDFEGGTIKFKTNRNDNSYTVYIAILFDNQELVETEITIDDKEFPDSIELDGFRSIKVIKPIEENDEERAEKLLQSHLSVIAEEMEQSQLVGNNKEEIILELPTLKQGYSYTIRVNEKGSGKIIYRNVGVCVVAPDGELAKETVKIGKRYGVKVHKIDPSKEEIAKGSIATFNPLLRGEPEKVGDIISSILISMDSSDDSKGNPYFTNASVRAVRNLIIILMVMHPKMYNEPPTLEDVLMILNNFRLIEPYVDTMKKDEQLRKRWSSVIAYFESSFYAPPTDTTGRPVIGSPIGSQYQKTKDAVSGIINQLDNFIGREELRYILCDRKKSINLKEILEKGECLAISTRQSELGARLGKAFALFFILSLQNEVLSRYSENENPEVPYHLVIDEFPFYVNEATEVFFTFARKYKCAVTIAIQNMGQLKKVSEIFGETIFTNTSTKILLPKSNVTDMEYWSAFFGVEEKVEFQTGMNTTGTSSDNPSYSESTKGTISEKNRVTKQEINDLHFQEAFTSFTDTKGRQKIAKLGTDFLDFDKTGLIDLVNYDFEQYNDETLEERYNRLNPKMNEIKNVVEEDVNDIDLTGKRKLVFELETKENNQEQILGGGQESVGIELDMSALENIIATTENTGDDSLEEDKKIDGIKAKADEREVSIVLDENKDLESVHHNNKDINLDLNIEELSTMIEDVRITVSNDFSNEKSSSKDINEISNENSLKKSIEANKIDSITRTKEKDIVLEFLIEGDTIGE
jgi:hypothetical protein